MIFRLARASVRTKIPLLAHDFTPGLPLIAGPSKDIFLCPLDGGLQKNQMNPMEVLRFFKEQPDRLRSGLAGPPAASIDWQQGRLYRMFVTFGRDLHIGKLL